MKWSEQQVISFCMNCLWHKYLTSSKLDLPDFNRESLPLKEESSPSLLGNGHPAGILIHLPGEIEEYRREVTKS